ncbi:MAG: 3-oxoacyl-[acyl-carrier-protein] reductase [Actinomycetia bacterium]|nr:3-oxoacyl-[acyl-carrier-protein] reductase [Actinomycetes bacterium]
MTESFASLQGRTALVTGGARGIGAAISRELCRAGASVCINYRSRSDTADELAAELGALAIQADISDQEAARALVEQAEAELGPLDILVNNAGITRDTLVVRMTDDDWSSVLDANLTGSFYTSRAVARGMLRRRAGSIVNTTSYVGIHGNPGQTNYAASKAGIIGFTKALAHELGARGVRVNAVAPGFISTELTDALPEEAKAAILQATPLGRLGVPADVSGCVRFLCSDEAEFITGAVILVDGGLGM